MGYSERAGSRETGPDEDAVVAVVAAVCAACGEEYRLPAAGTHGYPKGMPVWKRAALAELVNAGLEIRDFV